MLQIYALKITHRRTDERTKYARFLSGVLLPIKELNLYRHKWHDSHQAHLLIIVITVSFISEQIDYASSVDVG